MAKRSPIRRPVSSHRVYATLEELCEDYESGALHPGDLKPALSKHINKILQPVRDHFVNDPHAAELLKKVKVRVYGGAECICKVALGCMHNSHFPSLTVVQNHTVASNILCNKRCFANHLDV